MHRPLRCLKSRRFLRSCCGRQGGSCVDTDAAENLTHPGIHSLTGWSSPSASSLGPRNTEGHRFVTRQFRACLIARKSGHFVRSAMNACVCVWGNRVLFFVSENHRNLRYWAETDGLTSPDQIRACWRIPRVCAVGKAAKRLVFKSTSPNECA